jgi:tetratricopeptide (TPR) repeat protein
VLEQTPRFVPARVDRVLSWLRLREKERAAKDLEVLAEIAPNNSKYYLHLGFYQEAIGEYAAAHASITKAKELGDNFHGIEFKLNELEGYF